MNPYYSYSSSLQQQQPERHIFTAEIQEGLDFILSHFEEPLFPRKISTFKSNNKQFLVRSRQEIIDSFIDSKFVDCRINAFPTFTEYKGVQIYPPNFIFIDLDKNDFETIMALKLALFNTLKNIKEKLNGFPTVLWSGNGYHILLPSECPKILVDGVLEPAMLENITEFKNYDKPSEQFLRFVEDYLSNDKADKSNNPSFKSCLLRIPNSINSKNMQQVNILQKWNGNRSPLTMELLLEFKRYLKQKDRQKQLLLNLVRNRSNNFNNDNIEWIEKLLLIPIKIPRRICVDLIFVPYFILVKKLSPEETAQKITEWLDKCNLLRPLDFDIKYKINKAIENTNKNQIPPMKKSTLKDNYPKLYQILKDKGAIT